MKRTPFIRLVSALKINWTWLVLLGSMNAYSLGIGDIHVTSQLNEPFSATIELYGVEGVNTDELLVKIASKEAFEQAGIAREFFLTTLKFDVQLKEPALIRVSSKTPIKEPFLNFLLDIQSPKARFLKEYTVFLDPAK